MNIVLEKKYGNKEPMSFTVNNKDDFLWALGNIWDAMKEQIEEETPKTSETEEEFWKKLLSDTIFDTKEELLEWMATMKNYGLQVQRFDWFEFRKETVNEFIAEKTGYTDFNDMIDTLETYSDVLDEIKDTIHSL